MGIGKVSEIRSK